MACRSVLGLPGETLLVVNTWRSHAPTTTFSLFERNVNVLFKITYYWKFAAWCAAGEKVHRQVLPIATCLLVRNSNSSSPPLPRHTLVPRLFCHKSLGMRLAKTVTTRALTHNAHMHTPPHIHNAHMHTPSHIHTTHTCTLELANHERNVNRNIHKYTAYR